MTRQDPDVRPRDQRFVPGSVVAGRFRIDRELGSGGMGHVYAAEHLVLRVPVALKVLQHRPASSDETRRRGRLLREARAASRLASDHAVRVLDAGELEDGTPFLVMERLRGADVSDVLATEGRLASKTAMAIVLQACRAVGEAHGAGIVHRDLKPSNLFLCRRAGKRPLVKVLDFGIAKTDGDHDTAATATGMTIGSPRYMSPEQIRDPRRVDARSDVWSLGITLHELVTGHPPFESKFASALCAMIASEPPRLALASTPDVPAGLEPIIARCLAKSPADRYADAHALAAALEELAPDAEIDVALPEEDERPSVAPRREPEPSSDAMPSVTLLDTHRGTAATPAPATRGPRRGARRAATAIAIAVALAIPVVLAMRQPNEATAQHGPAEAAEHEPAKAAEAVDPFAEAKARPPLAKGRDAEPQSSTSASESASSPRVDASAPSKPALARSKGGAPPAVPPRGPSSAAPSASPTSDASATSSTPAAPPADIERAVLRDRR